MYKPKLEWTDNQRSELISFDERQQKELDTDLRVGDTVDDLTKKQYH